MQRVDANTQEYLIDRFYQHSMPVNLSDGQMLFNQTESVTSFFIDHLTLHNGTCRVAAYLVEKMSEDSCEVELDMAKL